jgi:large subunit ribosomal protein L7/L12
MADEKSTSAEATADKKEVQVPEKFKALVEQIEKLSVLDLAELVKVLEEKFGVSAAAPVMAMAAAGAPAAGAAPAEEQTTFNVELTDSGANKIGVIKVVRELTQMGLKDAKDLVDGAPKVVKEGVGKAEAEDMKKKLEASGAKVTLK